MSKTFSCLLLLLCTYGLNAQKVQFEFFDTANGLSGNETSLPTQDQQGFLWFINNGKLHRFDGRTFLPYPSPPLELSGGQYEDLISVSVYKDSLLFVISVHHFYLFNPRNLSWQLVEKSNAKDLYFAWQQGRESDFIIHTSKNIHELDFWQLKDGALKPIPISIQPKVLNGYYWVDFDQMGDLYIANRDTLFHLNPKGQVLHKTSLNSICTDCYNYCFQFDSNNNLLLLVNWQIYILDKKNNTFSKHPASRFLPEGENHLHRFFVEENGSIWACGQLRNLVYYDAINDTLYNFKKEMEELLPNTNDFRKIFKDRSGVLWVSTYLGLLKISHSHYPFNNYFTGLNPSKAHYSFRGFSEDEQGMIYGYFYSGIAQVDPSKKKELKIHEFDNSINSFNIFTRGKEVLINAGQSIDFQTGTFHSIPGDFHPNRIREQGFFVEDQQQLWWLGDNILYSFKEIEGRLHTVKVLEIDRPNLSQIEALHLSKQSKKFWISIDGELLRFDPKTKEKHWFNLELSSRILAIEEDPQENLWLATDRGLLYFNPQNNQTKAYTLNNGLPNNFVCGMLTEGDSALWLGTNHGLSRFHIPSETFINFLEKDGLSHNEFNRASYFKAKDGRMFFGGLRGFNAFYPQEVMKVFRQKNQHKAQVLLTAFEYTDERNDSIIKINNFEASPRLQLFHWDWSYRFEFALADYNNPSEILYSYKMEGYKDSWSFPSKSNLASYNSLPVGNYIFRVKARNPAGAWYSNELAVPLTIHPPWWKTNLAYGIYLLLFLAICYAIFHFTKKRLLLQSELKRKEEEALRLIELDQFKSKLYTNLTHEFRTPLTVILGMTDQIERKPEAHLKEGLSLIRRNGQNLLRLINQLLDLSKLENQSFQLNWQQADIIPFLRYLTQAFHSLANSKNLSIQFFTNIESLLMDYDVEQIKQIMSNLISNAIKFTPADGNIQIKVTREEEHLRIEVKDNGIGIAQKDIANIFDRFYQVDATTTREREGTGIGLAHTKELVRLMEGNIKVDSHLGAGSNFIVILPIRNKAPLQALAIEAKIGPPLPLTSKQKEISLLSQEEDVSPKDLPQLLIIEDNQDVVVYLRTCLEKAYQITVALNGRIGIEKALKNIPDIIISDVMMPEKNGYEVCDVLKTDERTSHIPIILLTAKADVASKLRGLNRGADAYLAKPFDQNELLIRLEQLVKRQSRMVAYFSNHSGSKLSPSEEIAQAVEVEDVFIQKVRDIIETHYSDEDFGLPVLCQKIRMSRSQLFRKMKALTNTAPSDYIRHYRLQKAKQLLETTNLQVAEVAYEVGFKDPSYFSKIFQDTFGCTPSATNK